jgi:hypothetical protein
MSIKKKIGLSFFKKISKIIAKNCANFLEKKVGINLIIKTPSMTKKLGKNTQISS